MDAPNYYMWVTCGLSIPGLNGMQRESSPPGPLSLRGEGGADGGEDELAQPGGVVLATDFAAGVQPVLAGNGAQRAEPQLVEGSAQAVHAEPRMQGEGIGHTWPKRGAGAGDEPGREGAGGALWLRFPRGVALVGHGGVRSGRGGI